jgi:hypothetical protein
MRGAVAPARQITERMSDIVRYNQPKQASERSFGLVLAAAFAVIALWPLTHGAQPRLWSLAVAVAFLAAGLLLPAVLRWPNRLWHRLGLTLGKVVAPVMMAVMFFLVFAPVGALLRLMGKDLLRLSFDRKAQTYWIAREPRKSPAPTMRNQF